MRTQLSIGIDVGFSATARSTGVVILDRTTKTFPKGTPPVVERQHEAMVFLAAELERLKPASVTVSIDGPFDPAAGDGKARAVERFFASGPFASAPPRRGPRLRISPAPTRAGGKFLLSTSDVLAALIRIGLTPGNPLMSPRNERVVETFPTIFMATLLPPKEYTGERKDHTDELWARFLSAIHNSRLSPLVPYLPLMNAIEVAPRGELHDLRAAAVCAIAADLLEADGALGRASFIGTTDEGGFLLPPVEWWDPQFRVLFEDHHAAREDLRLEVVGVERRASGRG